MEQPPATTFEKMEIHIERARQLEETKRWSSLTTAGKRPTALCLKKKRAKKQPPVKGSGEETPRGAGFLWDLGVTPAQR